MPRSVRIFVLATGFAVFSLIAPRVSGLPHCVSTLEAHWHERLAVAASEGNDAGAVEHALVIVSDLIEQSVNQ